MIEDVIDSLGCGFYRSKIQWNAQALIFRHTPFLEVTNRTNGCHTFDFINSVQTLN
jgi:hypothetical protein